MIVREYRKEAPVSNPTTRIRFDQREMREKFDRQPFLVPHNLAGDPLFTFESLAELALRRPAGDVLHRIGKVPVDAQLDDAHLKHPLRHSLRDTLDNFDALKAVVTINFPENDPRYRPLVQEVIAEVKRAIEPLGETMTWYATYVFLSTPGSLTPYHMDRELNFLLQVEGRKRVQLWDPWDQRVMTTQQVEELFALWGAKPRPGWTAQLAPLASETIIQPGVGIHHPFIAPHLVETLERSVSWAITFRTRSTDRTTELAKINHRLRRLGMRPGRPGQGGVADAVKLTAGALSKPLISAARQLRRDEARS
jgi:hypothetical protein